MYKLPWESDPNFNNTFKISTDNAKIFLERFRKGILYAYGDLPYKHDEHLGSHADFLDFQIKFVDLANRFYKSSVELNTNYRGHYIEKLPSALVLCDLVNCLFKHLASLDIYELSKQPDSRFYVSNPTDNVVSIGVSLVSTAFYISPTSTYFVDNSTDSDSYYIRFSTSLLLDDMYLCAFVSDLSPRDYLEQKVFIIEQYLLGYVPQ